MKIRMVIILTTILLMLTSCSKPTEVRVLSEVMNISVSKVGDTTKTGYSVEPSRIEILGIKRNKELQVPITIKNYDTMSRTYYLGLEECSDKDYLEGYTYYPVDGLSVSFNREKLEVGSNSEGTVFLLLTRTKTIPNTLVKIRVSVLPISTSQSECVTEYIVKYQVKAVK